MNDQTQTIDNGTIALWISIIALVLVFYHHHLSGHVALGA